MYDIMSKKAEEFISDEEILETLEYADKNKQNRELIESIIEKAKTLDDEADDKITENVERILDSFFESVN